MKARLLLAVLILSCFFTGAVLGVDKLDEFAIDQSHSNIGFSVKHLVISKVKGKFNDFSGIIKTDGKNYNKSSVEVTIKVESIDTSNQKRDDHLRSADFFDVKKFPEIKFKSKKIKKKGGHYIAVGDFKMHGVTKKIEIPFKVTEMIKDPWGKTRFGVEAQLTIDRRDYGLKWSKTMETGSLVVGHEVEIELNVEAVK